MPTPGDRARGDWVGPKPRPPASEDHVVSLPPGCRQSLGGLEIEKRP